MTSPECTQRKARLMRAFRILGDDPRGTLEPMRIGIRSNVDEVLKDLDKLMAEIETVAVPRALEKLGNQAATKGVSEAAKVYRIKVSDVRPYVEVVVDRVSHEVSVVTKGKGFPLRVFNPQPTSTGIRFTVKGHQIEIPHAFFIRKLNNVFARGRYGQGGPEQARARRGARKLQLDRGLNTSLFRSTGEQFGRFAFGRGRFPIALLRSSSPPDAMNSDEVVDAMQARVDEQAAKVLKQEIAAVRRGF